MLACWLDPTPQAWLLFPKKPRDRVARTIAEAPHESGGTRTRQLDPRVRLSTVVVSERAPPNRPEPRFGPEARVLVAGDGPCISRRLECFVAGWI